MNPGFSEFLKATPQDRRDVFLATAARLGAPAQNVAKDFWVTWTLDVLFNGLPPGHPRFLFKGGTSLSKAQHPPAAGPNRGGTWRIPTT